jgi:hypothetical protein
MTKTKISAVALKKSPKVAWDLMEAEYNKQTYLDVKSLIMDLFNFNLNAFGCATEYLDQMKVINNSLDGREKKLDDAQVLSKVKADLIQDGRYKHIITSSLLNQGTTYCTLKAALVAYNILTTLPSKSFKRRGKEEEKALASAKPASRPQT